MAMSPLRLTIEGLQELQAVNLQMIAALQPSGAFGRAIKYATTASHRYAVAITHVDTGALRASQRMEVDDRALRGRVFIDQTARNPVSGSLTAVYGVAEHARGGEHAFYERVIDERAEAIAAEAERLIVSELP